MERTKHSPNRLSSYIEIHRTVMQQFLGKGVVLSEDLSFNDIGNGVLLLEGTIACVDDLRIEVSKRLQIVGSMAGEPLVQTSGYSYSAILGKRGPIFRYDSPHPDHNMFHHVHRYAVLDGDVHGATTPIEEQAQWPTLGEVIQELCDWYYDNLTRLRPASEGQD